MTKAAKAFNRARQVLLKENVDFDELEATLKAVNKFNTLKNRAIAKVLKKTI